MNRRQFIKTLAVGAAAATTVGRAVTGSGLPARPTAHCGEFLWSGTFEGRRTIRQMEAQIRQQHKDHYTADAIRRRREAINLMEQRIRKQYGYRGRMRIATRGTPVFAPFYEEFARRHGLTYQSPEKRSWTNEPTRIHAPCKDR